MEFFSHPTKENGKVVGGKLIAEHNEGVQRISSEQFSSLVRFGEIEPEKLKKLLAKIVRYHDLLKYLIYFQEYLRGKEIEPALKAHARGGGHVFYTNNQQGFFPEQAFIGYFLIRGHHRDLWTPTNGKADPLVRDKALIPEELNTLRLQLLDLQSSKAIIKEQCEIDLPEFDGLTVGEELFREARMLTKPLKRSTALSGPGAYFLINYLFSLLIEADKLDASQNDRYQRKSIPIGSVHDKLLPTKELSGLNLLRHQTRMAVRAKIDADDLLEYSIYTLTAPTGIGKTLTALDFALLLRDKLANQREGKQPLIVTALPFINIIEQTLEVYQEFINSERVFRVVGHYQFADVLGDRADVIGKEENDTKDYASKLMELNTWQADVVVTSFVQLFHTLISGRNKSLKKFHHLAGAILIMDEVQTVPLDLAPFLGSILYYLTKHLGTKIIMMTATQPKLVEFTDRQLLNRRKDSMAKVSMQLLDNPEVLFRKFSRTVLVPLITESLKSSDEFVELFQKKWSPEKATLIVVNTVKRSIEIYQKLFDFLGQKGLDTSLHYLSTNVLPVHRSAKIDTLKKLLKKHRAEEKKPATYCAPILVTTQVVEAGVDLDFDIGFRDIGPVDSIVQVAGRLNRENSTARANSPLYIISFGPRNGYISESQLVYGNPVIERVQAVFKGKDLVVEADYFEMVDHYFTSLAGQQHTKEVEERLRAVETLDYDGEKYGMNQFRYIKENDTTATVLIELETAQAAILAYRKLKELVFTDKKLFYEAQAEYDQKYKTIFQQHTLNVPKKYTEGLATFDTTNYLFVPFEDRSIWYNYAPKISKKAIGFQREINTDDNTATIL